MNTPNPDLAKRFNAGKTKWTLVDFKSLKPMVDVLEYGANKYGLGNWQKGFPERELLDSLLRHVLALSDGEAVDPESKLHHIGHILCNAMYYSYHFVQSKGITLNLDEMVENMRIALADEEVLDALEKTKQFARKITEQQYNKPIVDLLNKLK